MALSAQQEETLERLRARGLKQPAGMLEGLYAQINERPDDGQITEMIANMLQQYMRDGDAIRSYTIPALDAQSFAIIAESGSTDMSASSGSASGTVVQDDEVPGQAHDNFLGLPVGKVGQVGQVRTDVEGNGVLEWVDPPPCSMFEECSLGDGHLEPHNDDRKPKLQLQLIPWAFLEAMARVAQDGIKGARKAHDWKGLDAAGLEDKQGALLRHYGKREWAAVGFNAAILWWHDRKSK